jgi:hypothetical protein
MIITIAALALAASAADDTQCAAMPLAPAAESAVVLKQDTPVELMALSEVTTRKAAPGTIFKMRVNRAIEVDGKIVVPVGAFAYGEVITAKSSGSAGVSGKMTAHLLCIRLGDAVIPLEGEVSAKGQGAGSAGVAVVLVGVMGIFHRGNDAKIKAGQIVGGFVSEDVSLDLAGPAARRVEAAAPAVVAATQ